MEESNESHTATVERLSSELSVMPVTLSIRRLSLDIDHISGLTLGTESLSDIITGSPVMSPPGGQRDWRYLSASQSGSFLFCLRRSAVRWCRCLFESSDPPKGYSGQNVDHTVHADLLTSAKITGQARAGMEFPSNGG